MGPITLYDAVFRQAVEGTSIPFDFLRSLARYESNFDPNAIGPGQERGLLQIAKVTLRNYNREMGKNITAAQSSDPLTNAQISVWLIQRIVKSFFAHHPLTLSENWDSERYVGLVVQAYNAGEGESKGVGALVGKLEAQGVARDRITYKTVAQANETLKINPWLSEARRVTFVGKVVADYFANKQSTPVSAPSSVQYPDLPASSATTARDDDRPVKIDLPPLEIPVGVPQTASMPAYNPPSWTEYLVLGAIGGGLLLMLSEKRRVKKPMRLPHAPALQTTRS